VAVIRNFGGEDDLALAAGLVRNFSKKGEGRSRGLVLSRSGDVEGPEEEVVNEIEVSAQEWQSWQN
jgi:hypothetical protein